MKNIAVLSGDKRQIYANSYLNNNGFCSYIKNNFDFNEDAYILCGTPFSKDSLYLNCDLYSSFPISTFITLLKPGQTVFAGNISSDVTTSLKKKNPTMTATNTAPEMLLFNILFYRICVRATRSFPALYRTPLRQNRATARR